MKIAIIVNNLSVSGGYQKLVIRSAIEMQVIGHRVTVYTQSLDKSKCYPDLIDKINIVNLDDKSISSKIYNLLNNYFPIKEIKQIILFKKLIDSKFDYVIIHNDDILYTLIALSSKLKITWMVNNQFPSINYNIISIVKSHLSYEHFSIRIVFDKIVTLPKIIFLNILFHLGLSKVNICATYDIYNKNLISKHTNRKTVVVYAGADFPTSSKSIEFSKKDHEDKLTHLLSVGVLFPYRRYEDIIRAISVKPLKYKLTIVGKKSFSLTYYNYLVELVSELKATNVFFVDYCSLSELNKLYDDSDMFVFVNDANTFGISVFESILLGLPTIITNNIGAADILKKYTPQNIVSPRNFKELRECLDLVDSKYGNQLNISRNINSEIRNILSWKEYTNRILSTFNL